MLVHRMVMVLIRICKCTMNAHILCVINSLLVMQGCYTSWMDVMHRDSASGTCISIQYEISFVSLMQQWEIGKGFAMQYKYCSVETTLRLISIPVYIHNLESIAFSLTRYERRISTFGYPTGHIKIMS